MLVVATSTLAIPAGRLGAQEPEPSVTPTSVVGDQVPTQQIIPEPNSGREPSDAGDRGGALQVATFLVLVGGVAAVVALAVRESRRARAAGSTPDASGPPSDRR